MTLLIIANPFSGGYDNETLNRVKSVFENSFSAVSVVFTKGPGHGKEIARNAKEDIIVAAGGDGLINEAASGLVGTDKLFSALPFGTANVFCREYGFGLDPVKAAAKLKISRTLKIPVGYVDGVVFLSMAGFGFDAAAVDLARKRGGRRFKILAHILGGAEVLLKGGFRPFTLYSSGMRKTVYHMIISLGSRYGGGYKLGDIQRGRLNVFFIASGSRWPLIKNFISVIGGRGFVGNKTTSDYIKIEGASSCEIDGEFLKLNKSSVFIKIKRNALNLAY